MALSYKNDSETDERLNPSSTSSRLSASEQATFDQIESGLRDNKTVSSPDEDVAIKNAQDKLRDKENFYAPNHTGVISNSPRRYQKGSLFGKFFWKRKGATGVVIGLAVGGVMFVGTVGTTLAGLTFVNGLTGDLYDRLAALTEGNNKILQNKLYKSAKAGSLKGCSKLSMGCKMRTFSKTELARMKRAGIEVIPDGKSKITGRTKASGIKFGNETLTPEQWNDRLKSKSQARNAQLRANNMSYRGYTERGPFGKVLKVFGVNKKPPGLKGNTRDRINQLMTAAGADSVKNVKFVDVTTDDGSPTGEKVLDDGTLTLREDGTISPENAAKSNNRYTEGQAEKIKKDLESKTAERITANKPPSKTAKASIGAASILGFADLGCSIKNMIVATSVAAKIANSTQLVKYSMPVLSLISKMQAGDASPEDVEALGTMLTEVDNRKQVVGPVKTNDGTYTDGMINNPNYGKSMMDSVLLNMSITGSEYVNIDQTTEQFKVGMGMNSLLSVAGVSDIGNFGGTFTKTACNVIQNPLTRAGGILVSVIVGGFSLGSVTAAQVTLMGGMIAGMMILERALNFSLSGNLTSGLEDDKRGRGEALWTGYSVLEGAASRQTGLMPASVDDLVKNQELINSVQAQYASLEREDAKNNPFDITNKYTFIGAASRSFFGTFGYSMKPLGIISGISKTSMNIFGFFNPVNASKKINPDRFKKCDDESYKALGVDADVQCNIRYVMPKEDLGLDIDNVELYMEQNGYISPDSETGLPDGYTTPDQQKQQEGLMGTVAGVVDGATIGQFFDTSGRIPNGNEYAKFLESCVYRVKPFGPTGEETGLIGGLGEEWESGANCRKKGKPYSYFRAWTLYRSLVEMNDEEELATTNTSSTQAAVDTPSRDGWSKPINAAPGFGWHETGSKGLHKGLDFPAPHGTPVYAARDGVVTKVWDMGSCGWATVISANGLPGLWHAYQHMDPIVKLNDAVKGGQKIGTVGSFCGSGTHLHFSIETQNRVSSYKDAGSRDTSRNPKDYLPL